MPAAVMQAYPDSTEGVRMSPFREAGAAVPHPEPINRPPGGRLFLRDLPPPSRPAATILLAEDEELVRALVREVLGRQGYTVLEAENGEAALRLCQQYPGAIDLLVTDVVMPKMSGPELARRAAAIRPATRVLY